MIFDVTRQTGIATRTANAPGFLQLAGFVALLLTATPVDAQDPQVTLALDPEGPVTVGTPVKVSVTVLVPTYMPAPPDWPDLQIADAVTRLPDRATHPVTTRVGEESWSGLTRTWEIIPQRPADFDLGAQAVTLTYADPETNAPVEASVSLPDIAFSATVPPGAEGIDPFLAATSLTLTVTVDGLPEAPKPGDAFTLTLTTTAEGPPAMLLPPLADRLTTPEGLRAYPRQPTIADAPVSSHTDTVAYVIERPGRYTLPAVRIDWWNTATAAPEAATSDAITLDVPAPPGWREATATPAPRRWSLLLVILLIAGICVALVCRRRPRSARAPSERSLRRAARQAIGSGPVGTIRASLAAWLAALPEPSRSGAMASLEPALRTLEANAYGPDPARNDEAMRRSLLAALSAIRTRSSAPRQDPLPAINAPRRGMRVAD